MQNIGERLEEARKRKGISIREAAEATKIRGDYLHKFESNQFDITLPEIYVRGFLRNYANYLGLPAEKIVNDYNALGHGHPKTKSLNREIYGRMELSVASAKDAGRDHPTSDEDRKNGDGETENPATFKPSPGALPYVDRALLIKGGAILGAVAIMVLLVVVTVRMFSGGDKPADTNAAATSTAKAAVDPNQIVIYALDNVEIKLAEDLNGQAGKILFQGTITRGDSRTFPRTGKLLLTASMLENVEVGIEGNRTNLTQVTDGLRGLQRVRIPGPSSP